MFLYGVPGRAARRRMNPAATDTKPAEAGSTVARPLQRASCCQPRASARRRAGLILTWQLLTSGSIDRIFSTGTIGWLHTEASYADTDPCTSCLHRRWSDLSDIVPPCMYINLQHSTT